jgi:hypothetical protein
MSFCYSITCTFQWVVRVMIGLRVALGFLSNQRDILWLEFPQLMSGEKT